MGLLNNTIRIIWLNTKKHGFLSTVRKLVRHAKSLISATNGLAYSGAYSPPAICTFLSKVKKKSLIKGRYPKNQIVWIMPTFNKGSGGHTTIFRFAKFFELAGYKNIFVIRNGNENSNSKLLNSDGLMQEIKKGFYTPINAEVRVYGSDDELIDEVEVLTGDIVIGTDLYSQLIALGCTRFNSRYLFLQDNESLFYPASTLSVFNDLILHDKDNSFVCAGEWLASLIEHDNKIVFKLGVDRLSAEVYSKFQRMVSSDKVKIAVYARYSSPRRCVEHILSILSRLNDLNVNFEVHAFGQDIENTSFPFKLISYGIISPNEMYRLIANADVTIAFSATNYSLLPSEALALNSISFDVDSSSNRLVYGTDGVLLLSPLVDSAARQLKAVIDNLSDADYRRAHEKKAVLIRNQLNWVRQLEQACMKMSEEFAIENERISVCIPTLNAGENFKVVLEALKSQKFVEIELCIIDSGSVDDTLKITRHYFPDARIKQIDKAEFGHGKTRNQLAELATNNFLLFLTQDAIPLDELLCVTLYKHIEKNPKIVGSFCRHVAYPHHNPFIRHSINEHFNSLSTTLCDQNFATNSDLAKTLKFFSTNCCMVRRSVLLDNPLPDVVYGEDQLWSFAMLNKGFGTAYVNDVAVMHSHDYDGDELFLMTKTDIEYHKYHFNDSRHMSLIDMDRHTTILGSRLKASEHELNKQLRKNQIIYSAFEATRVVSSVSYHK